MRWGKQINDKSKKLTGLIVGDNVGLNEGDRVGAKVLQKEGIKIDEIQSMDTGQ